MGNSNDLYEFFEKGDHRFVRKWVHYFDIYERYFSKFRDKPIVFVEIGIFQGGSLQMWKHYFGPKSRIIGIDIDERCKRFEEEGIEIYIGSQGDTNFINDLLAKIGDIDIILDDGGHNMVPQIKFFDLIYPKIKEGGIYMCEDTHSSYMLRFGGGYRRSGTYIERMKKVIDSIHAWHSEQRSLKKDYYTKNVKGIHFYESIVVVEKGEVIMPHEDGYGVRSFEHSTTSRLGIFLNLSLFVVDKINEALRSVGITSIHYGKK